jgi:hypothetical protein
MAILEVTESVRSEPNRDNSAKGREHVILQCSNCNEELVDLWISAPNEKIGKDPVQWKVKATCCYCGDQSFVKDIVGGFKQHGIIAEDDKNLNHYRDVTKVVDIRYEGNTIIFQTMKGEAAHE